MPGPVNAFKARAERERSQSRRFGLIVGGVFAVIGSWPWLFRGQPPRDWALVIAALLIVLALVEPRALRPLETAWMRLGNVLSWVNTRVILAVVFYAVLTPIGVVLRYFEKDPIRQVSPDPETYRVTKSRREASHMLRQF